LLRSSKMSKQFRQHYRSTSTEDSGKRVQCQQTEARLEVHLNHKLSKVQQWAHKCLFKTVVGLRSIIQTSRVEYNLTARLCPPLVAVQLIVIVQVATKTSNQLSKLRLPHTEVSEVQQSRHRLCSHKLSNKRKSSFHSWNRKWVNNQTMRLSSLGKKSKIWNLKIEIWSKLSLSKLRTVNGWISIGDKCRRRKEVETNDRRLQVCALQRQAETKMTRKDSSSFYKTSKKTLRGFKNKSRTCSKKYTRPISLHLRKQLLKYQQVLADCPKSQVWERLLYRISKYRSRSVKEVFLSSIEVI
jgi:hypothetical protein